jgi:chemotaxis protein methyltransferase CheR
MSLAAAFPAAEGWEVEVLATDLSTRMLARAREGLYPLARTRDVPRPLLHAFMLRGTGGSEGLAKVGPEVRPLVRFARLNLVDEGWPGLGTFDLLLCRNVLMYFAPATRARVLGRLLGHLAPDGALLLGHAESLLGTALPVVPLAPAVYVRADGPLAPARRREAARPAR